MKYFTFFIIVLTSSVNGLPTPNNTESARDIATDAVKAALAPLGVVVGVDSAVLGFSTVKLGEGVKSVGSGVVSAGDNLSNLGKDFQVIGSELFRLETGFNIPIVHTGTQIDALRVICKLPKLFAMMILGEQIILCNSSMILEDPLGDSTEFPEGNSNDDLDSATTLKTPLNRPPTPLLSPSTSQFKLPTTPSAQSTPFSPSRPSTPSSLSTSSTLSTPSSTASEAEIATSETKNFPDEE